MKIWRALALAGALVFSAGIATAEQAPYPQTEEALRAEYDKLNWQFEPVTYQFAASHSTFTLPSNYALLTGNDARRMLFLDNAVEFPQTEAIVGAVDGSSYVSFDYYEIGYIADDDWDDLDADALLAQIREGNDAANEERAKYGLTPLLVRGWLIRPSYDPQTRTARWAIETADSTGSGVNLSVLRLSRKGYHEITWVGPMDEFAQSGAVLDTILGAHAYEPGFRYADYVDGDMVAGFGIASLVAVAAGGEKTKGIVATIVAAALLFLKKGWLVIVAALGGGWAVVKRLLGRRQAASTPPTAGRSDTPRGGV